VTGQLAFGTLDVQEADDRWRDDVWTMKYLSGFKWEMLGEQVGMSASQMSPEPFSRVTQSEPVSIPE